MSEAVERNLRKTRIGMVVSDKMDKTIVVAVRDNVRSTPSTARSLREQLSSRRMMKITNAQLAIK